MESHSVPGVDENSEHPAERDPLVGATLAERYDVERVLGKGGMGTVYRARQRELDRAVAIKVILHDVASSAVMIERFRREAAATARLRHPNIVTVYDFAALPDGRLYLVMELLTGPTLEHWLDGRGTATPAEMLEVMRPVCRAIAALHRAGIVHRDLKPSNIVLPDPASPDDMLKVVDFGIARLREAPAGNLTGTQIIGTPGYLAPEVIEGGQAEPRSDIYALGILAYELLTGAIPFSGTTTGAILLQQLTRTPDPPSSRNDKVPVALDEVILRAVDQDPDARYQTAEELLAALESAIAPGATPRHPAAPATEAAAPERATLASILVIDDDEDLRMIMRAALDEAGYAVATAGDGIEALLKLGGATYDLILSDVDMPNLDGFKLLEMLSAKGITTPVIFVTGRVDAENEVRGLELGAVDYLHKPVLPPVLIARVKGTLARRMGHG